MSTNDASMSDPSAFRALVIRLPNVSDVLTGHRGAPVKVPNTNASAFVGSNVRAARSRRHRRSTATEPGSMSTPRARFDLVPLTSPGRAVSSARCT